MVSLWMGMGIRTDVNLTQFNYFHQVPHRRCDENGCKPRRLSPDLLLTTAPAEQRPHR
jgi:hypothetical protein